MSVVETWVLTTLGQNAESWAPFALGWPKTLKDGKRPGGSPKKDKKARRLIRSGSIPQALWGVEALGLSRQQLKPLRAAAAAATGINQTQRCPTTAIAITFERDPAEEVIFRQVSS